MPMVVDEVPWRTGFDRPCGHCCGSSCFELSTRRTMRQEPPMHRRGSRVRTKAAQRTMQWRASRARKARRIES